MRDTVLPVLLGLLAWCANPVRPSAQTPPPLAPGNHEFSIVHEGRTRQYIVHVPPDAGHEPLPVMLGLHGGAGNARLFEAKTGLDAVADRNDFLAVYPDGTGPAGGTRYTWDSGPNCCGYALRNDVDDVGFLAALIDDLAARTPIDRHRIYATGHSNGAMMAYRLAAKRADLVAAIGAVSGAMAVDDFKPSQPVAVLDIHSVDDPQAVYQGGPGPPLLGFGKRISHRSVMAGLNQWAAADGCAPEPVIGPTIDGVGDNAGQTVTDLTWPGCAPGGWVRHLRLTGVGHAWPGSLLNPPGGQGGGQGGGKGTTLIMASDSAWAFASQFSR